MINKTFEDITCGCGTLNGNFSPFLAFYREKNHLFDSKIIISYCPKHINSAETFHYVLTQIIQYTSDKIRPTEILSLELQQ